MGVFKSDFEWSERFIPAVRSVLAPKLIHPASQVQDRYEATDLIVLAVRDMRIAVRVRRYPKWQGDPDYAQLYPDDFTLRSGRLSGVPTEIDKVSEGWCDWMFYAHQAAPDPCVELRRWMIVDFDQLRYAFIKDAGLLHAPDGKRSGRRSNGDGTEFMWFCVSKIRRGLLVDSSDKGLAPYFVLREERK